jgi:CPA2 family monovalent cation:H+ antiporter-2
VEAHAFAVTMDNQMRLDKVVMVACAIMQELKIIASTRDERHAQKLYGSGITEVVLESIKSSLQFGDSLLFETGISMGLT